MIGYYVHHHGRGHLNRAASIAAKLDLPVTVLSSLPEPTELAPFAGWLRLAPDDDEVHDDEVHGVDAAARGVDVSAGGAVHWAPLRNPGYRDRMLTVAGWVRAARPSTIVVDVSVELTAQLRLLGVPVIVMAGAGVREDDAHRLCYRMAHRILVPWPSTVYEPRHLGRHLDKTDFVGAISRFDDRQPGAAPGRRRVLALFGAGGTDVVAGDVAVAAQACPGWTWTAHGLAGTPWTDDIWHALQDSDVVVTHGGQNALAEVAAARRAAVIVPQQRPFDEQHATAAALEAQHIAVVADRWPEPAQWPHLLRRAELLGGAGWSGWSSGAGAAKAAAAITRVALDA